MSFTDRTPPAAITSSTVLQYQLDCPCTVVIAYYLVSPGSSKLGASSHLQAKLDRFYQGTTSNIKTSLQPSGTAYSLVKFRWIRLWDRVALLICCAVDGADNRATSKRQTYEKA